MIATTRAQDEPKGDESRIVLVDWGSSRLRAFLQVAGEIVARREGPGIGTLKDAAIEVLRETLLPWRMVACFDRIVMCGMVGSRNGLVEVPYMQAPAGFSEWTLRSVLHETDDGPILIAAGVRGLNASGVPDIMRGEETQIFGALQCMPPLAWGRHTLLLPGTHSKWVQIIDGRITSIQTYLTGELYATLRDHSSLLHTGSSPEEEGGASPRA